MEHQHQTTDKSLLKQYTPLIIVLLVVSIFSYATYVVTSSAQLKDLMRYFMGYFFLLFGLFKTFDWKGFIMAYAEYDIIAKRSKLYAALYPAIEVLLGLAYLSNIQPLAVASFTAIIMGISSIGVIQTLRDKKKIRCACLGTVVKLPMTTVTVIEDVGMGLMAVAMVLAQ